MALSKSKLSQRNSDSMVDLSFYESQHLYNLSQCPKCEKQALAHIGTKFNCIWCDFSRDITQGPRKTKPSGNSESGFWFLLVSAIIIVLIFHANG